MLNSTFLIQLLIAYSENIAQKSTFSFFNSPKSIFLKKFHFERGSVWMQFGLVDGRSHFMVEKNIFCWRQNIKNLVEIHDFHQTISQKIVFLLPKSQFRFRSPHADREVLSKKADWYNFKLTVFLCSFTAFWLYVSFFDISLRLLASFVLFIGTLINL